MNLSQCLIDASLRLSESSIPSAQLDARLLIAHALGCERIDLIAQSERNLSQDECAAIEKLIARRAAHEPVGRILGQREFWGLPFHLNDATLEPRPDSETLIEAVLDNAKKCGAPQTILDLGTGSGCLLLALLSEWPHALGTGIDKAPRAIEQAALNAQRLGLEGRATFQGGDWLEGLTQRFDLIVCNPPYIPSRDIAELEPEVKQHDPLAALDGGADGLAPYRHIIPQLPTFLRTKGGVFFEVGIGQAADIATMLRSINAQNIVIKKDLGGVDRVVGGIWSTSV